MYFTATPYVSTGRVFPLETLDVVLDIIKFTVERSRFI